MERQRRGEIRWMCSEGDTQVAFAESDTGSMASAEEMVGRAYAEGRGVFQENDDGTWSRFPKGTPIDGKLVVIPQIKGG